MAERMTRPRYLLVSAPPGLHLGWGLVLALGLTFAAGCALGQERPEAAPRSMPPEGSQAVPMKRLFTSQDSGSTESRRLVIRDLRQWASMPGDLARAIPPVDFGRSMVIVAAMGQRPTAGHSISIERVSVSGGRLFVVVRQVSPGPGCMVAQVLTSPIDVVEVPRSDEPVEFVEQSETGSCR